MFAGVRFAVTGRDGGNRTRGSEKRRNKEMDDRVSGYSLMLSEWSVKTGLKCSGVMKD